jgi:hypothetical protein
LSIAPYTVKNGSGRVTRKRREGEKNEEPSEICFRGGRADDDSPGRYLENGYSANMVVEEEIVRHQENGLVKI